MNETDLDTLFNIRHTLSTTKNFLSSEACKEIIIQMERLIQSINQKIKADCQHEYVDDYIDIDPDNSQRVCYCNICWSTFPVHN